MSLLLAVRTDLCHWMNSRCPPYESLCHWWIWSHHITLSQEAPEKGEEVAGKREESHWAHRFSHKTLSNSPTRAGRQHLKTCSWFPSLKTSGLGSQIRQKSSFQHWHRLKTSTQRAQNSRSDILSTTRVSKRLQEANRQGFTLSWGDRRSFKCTAGSVNKFKQNSQQDNEEHLWFLLNKTLVICTKASRHIRICSSYLPGKQLLA